MKKSRASLHHAAAILIDVLIAVLALMAFLFLHETTKTNSEPKPAAPAVSRPVTSWGMTAERPAPRAVAAKATITQVRFEGGRVVPVLSR